MVMSLVKMACSFPCSLAVAWYSTLRSVPDGHPLATPHSCQNIPCYGILWHSVCGQIKEG